MADTLKYEHILPGERVRAFDWPPFQGRPGRYVEGEVVEHQVGLHGVKFLLVRCDVDTTGRRVGLDICVPMETTFDYDGRVEVLP